jgi:hypothetical protein
MIEAPTSINAQEFAAQPPRGSVVGRFAYVLRVHVWLLMFVIPYFIAAVVTSDETGHALLMPWNYLQRVLIILGVLIPWGVAGYSVYLLWKFRPRQPTRFVFSELSRTVFTFDRCWGAVLTLSLLFLHATAFSFFKCLITDVRPFCFDNWLAACDAFIHFGRQPWQLLQPILGYPAITRLIDFCYILWAVVVPLGIISFAVGKCGSRLRMQVLLTNVVAWSVLGNIVALGLSSAGPCYFEHVSSSADPYAPLMEYLARLDGGHRLFAVGIQSLLWDGLSLHNTTFGYGISAMPSMHVGSTLLLALAARKVNRLLASVLFLYTIIMMIGSVHLGWHYAVDGYVAILGVSIIWWVVGKLLGRDSIYDEPTGLAMRT